MSIDDKPITNTLTFHLSRSKFIQHNTVYDLTLTGKRVVWWHEKDLLGAVSAGYH